jgi:hypothetical protein
VRRLTAVLLGLALTAGGGSFSGLHVHQYTGHDHPEHHHGLAAHEHDVLPAHGPESGVRLETCDPGQHAIRFAFVSAAPPQAQALVADRATPATATPDPPVRRALDVLDVRVHGPPSHGQASPRAPPDSTSA